MLVLKVSWIRRRGSEMSLLTTEQLVFSADSRFSVLHRERDSSWSLVIRSVQERDGGEYLCQVNTHPPASLVVRLLVIGKKCGI